MPRPVVNRLDRYVFRQLLIALLAATSALVALIWLTQSLRFVELVVNRGLSLWVFLQLTGLLIPNFVAVILPITTFVVVQFVYGRLSGDRELTVMRAAGMSPIALARAGPGAGRAGDGAVLRPERLGGAQQLRRLPRVPVRDPQPHRRLPAAGRRVHARLGRSHRLRPLAGRGRHVARHPGARTSGRRTPRDHPGRSGPADRGAGRPGGAAAATARARRSTSRPGGSTC